MSTPQSASKRGPYKKSEKTRNAILSAALQEAGKVGLQKTTIEAIARQADVAVGVVYYHFKSRDDVVDQLLQRLDSQLRDMETNVAQSQGSFMERSERRIRDYLRFVSRNPNFVRLFEDLRIHFPETYRNSVDSAISRTREELTEAIAKGEIRELDAKKINVVAYLLMGITYFADQMLVGLGAQNEAGMDFIVNTFMEILWSGLNPAD